MTQRGRGPGPRADRGRWRPAVAVIGVVVLAGAAGYVLWDRVGRRAGPENPGKECPPVVQAASGRALAAFGVRRVALVGDSIMFDPSCAIGASLSDVGITTARHAIPGSGLLDDPDSWTARMQSIVTEQQPDVVVAIFVGNYLRRVRDPAGVVIEPDSPEFFAAWQQRAEDLSAAVRAGGARMYWVSPPPIEIGPLAGRADRLFRGYRSIDGDHFLDSGAVLAGDRGGFTGVARSCGEVKGIRTFDGVHLTDDGARVYGQQIAHDLTADLGLLTAPKPC